MNDKPARYRMSISSTNYQPSQLVFNLPRGQLAPFAEFSPSIDAEGTTARAR